MDIATPNPAALAAELPFELESLKLAKNYQAWVSDTVQPFLGKRILEIGSGIGNLSQWLPVHERLILTEADPILFQTLKNNLAPLSDKKTCHLIDVSTDWIEPFKKEQIDTIVSFNVLEHIEDDKKALKDLGELLKQAPANQPRRLVSFVPAHDWAYGTMDKSFHHHRRYSHKDLLKISHELFPTAKITYRYFNLAGLPGWIMMGKILKKESFDFTAVKAFEKICPYIRDIDDFIHEKLRIPFGQSLLFVIEL